MVSQTILHCGGKILEWRWSSNNELLPAPFWTACFLVDGLLIDCGAPDSVDELKDFVKNLGESEQVKKCFITHWHEDHCGGAHMLQEEFGIPVYAGKKAVALLNKEKDYPDYRQITWGKHYVPFEAEPIESPISTASGKYTFELFPMVGHSVDLMAPIEPNEEWAFTTDAVMPKYTMIFGKNTDIPEDLSQIYDSIQKLYEYSESMNDLKIFTSGRGVFEGRNFLKEKMEELEDLHQKAHMYYAQAQQDTPKEKRRLKYVLRKMFHKESFVGKFTRGDLSNMNLINSLLEWPLNGE